MNLSLHHFTLPLATAGCAIGLLSATASAQDDALNEDALKILNDAFDYYQNNPFQFTSTSTIVQEMGARTNKMEVGQKFISADGKFLIQGTTKDTPSPTVHLGDGKGTVVFEEMKSMVSGRRIEKL